MNFLIIHLINGFKLELSDDQGPALCPAAFSVNNRVFNLSPNFTFTHIPMNSHEHVQTWVGVA